MSWERLGQLSTLRHTHNILADVSDGLQRGLFHVLCAVLVRYVSHQLGNELGPLAHGDLGAGNAGHALRGRAGPVRLRAQRLQDLWEGTSKSIRVSTQGDGCHRNGPFLSKWLTRLISPPDHSQTPFEMSSARAAPAGSVLQLRLRTLPPHPLLPTCCTVTAERPSPPAPRGEVPKTEQIGLKNPPETPLMPRPSEHGQITLFLFACSQPEEELPRTPQELLGNPKEGGATQQTPQSSLFLLSLRFLPIPRPARGRLRAESTKDHTASPRDEDQDLPTPYQLINTH